MFGIAIDSMNGNSHFHKTRIAPTPSAYLHLGNILSFAITAALADRTGASILLRIDDSDRERTQRAYVDDIFDTLNFMQIPWHEGPRNFNEFTGQYTQQKRIHLYEQALEQLKESGHLYACTCTRTDIIRINADSTYPGTCRHKNISLDTPGVAWRLKTDSEKPLHVKIYGAETAVRYLPGNMYDFVARRKDGFPGYQLTSLIDDMLFGIDLVVRGDDLWPSTIAQIYLANVLGATAFLNTTFHHHPLLSDTDGKKLSKSEGATSVYHLRKDYKTAGDIYSLILESAGIDGLVDSWQTLVSKLGKEFIF